MAARIGTIFEDSRARCGAPRIHAELVARGERIARKTVAKLMKRNGIRPPRRGRRLPRTTDSRHKFGIAPMVHRTRFRSRGEAKAALFECIAIFHNRRRRHSSISYRTPEQARIDMTRALAA